MAKTNNLIVWALIISVVGIVVYLVLVELDFFVSDTGSTLTSILNPIEGIVNTVLNGITSFFNFLGKWFKAPSSNSSGTT